MPKLVCASAYLGSSRTWRDRSRSADVRGAARGGWGRGVRGRTRRHCLGAGTRPSGERTYRVLIARDLGFACCDAAPGEAERAAQIVPESPVIIGICLRRSAIRRRCVGVFFGIVQLIAARGECRRDCALACRGVRKSTTQTPFGTKQNKAVNKCTVPIISSPQPEEEHSPALLFSAVKRPRSDSSERERGSLTSAWSDMLIFC